MNATVQYKNHHGLSVAFPLCDIGKRFAAIAGTAHLNKPTIEHMKALGVSFEVVQEQRSV